MSSSSDKADEVPTLLDSIHLNDLNISSTSTPPADHTQVPTDPDLPGQPTPHPHSHPQNKTRASPPGDLFRNLRNAQRFSIDIGGSLTKIAYFSKVLHKRVKVHPDQDEGQESQGTTATNEFTYEILEGARLHFIKFETKYIEECFDFIQKRLLGSLDCMRGKCIKVTGGGAYKYSDLLQEKLGVTPEKEDELGCLIKGANFLLKNVANEAFSYERKREPAEYQFFPAGPVLYPYLLVNIGSGVSILKVESEDEFQRVGGTATGGGTFWGLGTLLTGAKGFDELLELAEKGDHRNVDLLVKDIYSGDYVQLGLPGDLIASSFGKATYTTTKFPPADLARSLLFTIANDIGQIACLYALQHDLPRIYFGGYFLRNHPLSMSAVSYSIQYWSKKTVEALFLRHEGYLGAIGAFLRGTEELESDKYSWSENFSGSSGSSGLIIKNNHSEIADPSPPRLFSKRGSIEQLEIDRLQQPVGFFPLLSSSHIYVPDTVDLTVDSDARVYWLNCFEGWVEKITSRAIESQPDHPTTTDRALRCRHKLQSRLKLLQRFPIAFGTLTVRSLLDTIEQSLREFEFHDPYFIQKKAENLAAVSELNSRLAYLDHLTESERQAELILGVLAGNVFDWGAKVVTSLLEGPDLFGFEQAKEKVEQASWVMNCMDEWKLRILDGMEPYKCVAVFVDNSGVDFVLGIIPFVREFLKRGSKVILCPNSDPAVNDITYPEMTSLLTNQISQICPIISSALTTEQLLIVSTGQGSPCLDLSRVSQDLISCVQSNFTDLVIIEGMGRAIHTNLHAKFNVDVLKLAVIKNVWLAQRLGGELYSAIFSYEPASQPAVV